jgi:hypothetical protein
MLDGGDSAGFALEPLQDARRASDLGGQDLDGDRAVQARVSCAVNLAHRSCASESLDPIRTKRRPGNERQEIPVR